MFQISTEQQQIHHSFNFMEYAYLPKEICRIKILRLFHNRYSFVSTIICIISLFNVLPVIGLSRSDSYAT